MATVLVNTSASMLVMNFLVLHLYYIAMMLMTSFGLPRMLMQALALAAWILGARRGHRGLQDALPTAIWSLGRRHAIRTPIYIVVAIVLLLHMSTCGEIRGAVEATFVPTPMSIMGLSPRAGHITIVPRRIMLPTSMGCGTIDGLHIQRTECMTLTRFAVVPMEFMMMTCKAGERLNTTASDKRLGLAATSTHAHGSRRFTDGRIHIERAAYTTFDFITIVPRRIMRMIIKGCGRLGPTASYKRPCLATKLTYAPNSVILTVIKAILLRG